MIPFLYIQTELADRYNLDLTQTAVLSAVAFYCRKEPFAWKRNAEQICRDWPFMPSVTTVKRALCSLIKKNLLTVQNDRITVQIDRPNVQNDRQIVQIDRPNVQNDRPNVQIDRKNVQNDRLNNNINNNKNNIIFFNNAQCAGEKEKEIDFKLNSSFNDSYESEPTYEGVPSWDEVWDYAKQNSITFSETKKFYNYYNAYGWVDKNGRPVKQWASLFQSFVDYSREHDKKQSARFATFAQTGYPETAWGDRQRAMDARIREEREIIEARKAREREQSRSDNTDSG